MDMIQILFYPPLWFLILGILAIYFLVRGVPIVHVLPSVDGIAQENQTINYTVNNQSYTEKYSNILVHQLQQGQSVPVYYNPNNPKQVFSSPTTGRTWVITGSVLGLFALLFLAFTLRFFYKDTSSNGIKKQHKEESTELKVPLVQ
jgi:hypothetical protein